MIAVPEQETLLRPGSDVIGFDGHKIGVIVAVDTDHVVVEKGYLAPIRYRVPTGAVAGYEDGKVLLSVTKNQALSRGWETGNPTAAAKPATTDGLALATDAGAASDTRVLAERATSPVPELAPLTN